MKIELEGYNKLLNNIDRMNIEIGKRAHNHQIRTSYKVLRDAKNYCPVGPTGNLRRSGHVVLSSSDNVILAPGETAVEFSMDYAYRVESKQIKTRNGLQPFLAPALKTWSAFFKDGLIKILKQTK